MSENKEGTILLTGATTSLRGKDALHAFACPKFALRALYQSLARESQKQHIHVADVIIDVVIWLFGICNSMAVCEQNVMVVVHVVKHVASGDLSLHKRNDKCCNDKRL